MSIAHAVHAPRPARATSRRPLAMIVTLPPTVIACLIAGVSTGAERTVAAAFACFFLGMSLGAALVPARTGARALAALLACGLAASSIGLLAPTFVGRMPSSLLLGAPVERLVALLPLCAWLLLFARAVSGRAWSTGALGLALAAAILVLFVVPPVIDSAEASQTQRIWPALAGSVGKPLPDVRLVDIDGRERSFAEFRGRLLLVNFWKTDSAPSRREMPALAELARAFAGRGLSVVGVCDAEAGEQRAIAARDGIDYPLLVEPKDPPLPAPFAGVDARPAFVLVGRDGTVLRVFGIPSVARIRRAVSSLL